MNEFYSLNIIIIKKRLRQIYLRHLLNHIQAVIRRCHEAPKSTLLELFEQANSFRLFVSLIFTSNKKKERENIF